jgi:hypothetical protein
MELLDHVVLVVHLLGWAVALGGLALHVRTGGIPRGTVHGVLTALVTGILLVGLLEAGDEPVNTVKVTVKAVVALVVTGLVLYGSRRPEKATPALVGSALGLLVLNVSLAVLW